MGINQVFSLRLTGCWLKSKSSLFLPGNPHEGIIIVTDHSVNVMLLGFSFKFISLKKKNPLKVYELFLEGTWHSYSIPFQTYTIKKKSTQGLWVVSRGNSALSAS